MKKHLVRIILILLLTGNVVFWASQKEGFHVDEMFSYEQVGNTEYPKPEYDRPDEPCMDHWHSRAYYEDYLTIDSDEAFRISDFYSSASRNTAHPPLYLTLLGMTISAVSPNHFTKWSGICINILFFVLMQIFFFDLSKCVLKKEKLALLCTFLEGICVGVVSAAMFIRVYMILMFFTTAFMDLHVRMLGRKPDPSQTLRRRIPAYLSMIAVFILGALAHYYFLIFATFVFLGYLLILHLSKQYRFLAEYSITGGIGLLGYVCLWPGAVRDLLFESRGVEAVGFLISNSGRYLDLLRHSLRDMDRQITGGYGVLLLILVIITLLAHFLRTHPVKVKMNADATLDVSMKAQPTEEPTGTARSKTLGAEWMMFLWMFLVSLFYFLIITKISPFYPPLTFKESRYFLNIFPCILLCIVFVLDKCTLCYKDLPLLKVSTWSVLIVLVLLSYLSNGVDYLYPGADQQLEQLEAFKNDKAVYITEVPFICSNLNVYFTKADAVYQTDRIGASSLSQAFEGLSEKEILLYISTDTENVTEVLQTVAEELDADNSSYLFETSGLNTAQVFLLTLTSTAAA